MDSLIVIVLSVIAAVRFWRGIITAIMGLLATFLGGPIAGIIAGILIYAYLSSRFSEPQDTSKEDPDADPPPR